MHELIQSLMHELKNEKQIIEQLKQTIEEKELKIKKLEDNEREKYLVFRSLLIFLFRIDKSTLLIRGLNIS